MTMPFDIFRVETGGVRWLEPAATLEDAQGRVQKLAAVSLGKYLILNQETGRKLVIEINGVGGSRASKKKSVRSGEIQ